MVRLPLAYRAYRPIHHTLTWMGGLAVADYHPALVLRNRLSRTLYRRVFRDPRVVLVPMRAGFSMSLVLDDLATAEMVFEGHYAPEEARVLEALMDRCDCFIDVGANYGYFSLLAVTRRGEAISVIAVEPNPTLAAIITRSAEYNEFRNITVKGFAVGAAAGESRLRVDVHASATSALVTDDDEAVAVEVVTVDELLAGRPPNERVLLKVDVEGLEAEVVEGAQRTLSEGAVLACEVFASTADALLRTMHEFGYRAYRHNGKPLGSDAFGRHRRLDLVFLPPDEVPSWD